MKNSARLLTLIFLSISIMQISFAHPQDHITPCSYLYGKTLRQIDNKVLLGQLYKQNISIHDHKAQVVACHENGKYAWVTINSPIRSNNKRITIDTCGFLVTNTGQPVYLPTGHFSHNYIHCQPDR